MKGVASGDTTSLDYGSYAVFVEGQDKRQKHIKALNRTP